MFAFFMFPDGPCKFKSGAEIRELDREKQECEYMFPKIWARRNEEKEMKTKHRNEDKAQECFTTSKPVN